jgi:hypothetical protein
VGGLNLFFFEKINSKGNEVSGKREKRAREGNVKQKLIKQIKRKKKKWKSQSKKKG